MSQNRCGNPPSLGQVSDQALKAVLAPIGYLCALIAAYIRLSASSGITSLTPYNDSLSAGIGLDNSFYRSAAQRRYVNRVDDENAIEMG